MLRAVGLHQTIGIGPPDAATARCSWSAHPL